MMSKVPEVYETVVLAINSDLASVVEIKHRFIGNEMLEATLAVLDEIQCNSVVNVAGRDGNIALAELTIAVKAKALKDLTYAIDKAVTIERKIWNMDNCDGKPGGATGIIQVNINVLEPKPLPKRFR